MEGVTCRKKKKKATSNCDFLFPSKHTRHPVEIDGTVLERMEKARDMKSIISRSAQQTSSSRANTPAPPALAAFRFRKQTKERIALELGFQLVGMRLRCQLHRRIDLMEDDLIIRSLVDSTGKGDLLDARMESSNSNAVGHGQMTKASAENSTKQKTNVYIWDMDETLILFKSLLNGAYASSFNGSKDVQKGIDIGKSWENHILQVCDELFFYDKIENYNEPFLDALREYDDGKDLSEYDFSKDGFGPPIDEPNKRKLAYRHRVIAQKYIQITKLLWTPSSVTLIPCVYLSDDNMLDEEMIMFWDNLYEVTDAYTDRWLSSAKAFLELLSRGSSVSSHLVSQDSATDSADRKQKNINVLVTSGSLIPSLVKCLLFRLDKVIAHENGSKIEQWSFTYRYYALWPPQTCYIIWPPTTWLEMKNMSQLRALFTADGTGRCMGHSSHLE
ncbi:hypothetical protein ACLOJK_034005 [Asimina triloba]